MFGCCILYIFFLKNVSCDNQKLWENFLKTFETTLSSYSSSTMMWNEVCFLETLYCRSPLLFSLTQNLFNEISSSEVCSFQTTWQKCKISAFEECVMHFITCCMSSFYPITFLALGKVRVSVRFEKKIELKLSGKLFFIQ